MERWEVKLELPGGRGTCQTAAAAAAGNWLTSLFTAFRRTEGGKDRLQDGCTVYHLYIHACMPEELAGLLLQDMFCSAGNWLQVTGGFSV